jgi:hypothetical protein
MRRRSIRRRACSRSRRTSWDCAPIAWPFLAIGQPALAYNAAFCLSYVLSGLGAYFLAYVLTRRHDAALVSSLAFAFAPYRLSHTHHLQLLSSYWMPVALAALHLYAEDEQPRWAWSVRRKLADAGARLRLLPASTCRSSRDSGCSGSGSGS